MYLWFLLNVHCKLPGIVCSSGVRLTMETSQQVLLWSLWQREGVGVLASEVSTWEWPASSLLIFYWLEQVTHICITLKERENGNYNLTVCPKGGGTKYLWIFLMAFIGWGLMILTTIQPSLVYREWLPLAPQFKVTISSYTQASGLDLNFLNRSFILFSLLHSIIF